MFKDIIETIVKELQNEKTRENFDKYSDLFLGPLIYRLKISYYIIIFLLILMVANMIYSNILLSEIIRKTPFIIGK